jgi:hypothetical protein
LCSTKATEKPSEHVLLPPNSSYPPLFYLTTYYYHPSSSTTTDNNGRLPPKKKKKNPPFFRRILFSFSIESILVLLGSLHSCSPPIENDQFFGQFIIVCSANKGVGGGLPIHSKHESFNNYGVTQQLKQLDHYCSVSSLCAG